MDGRRILIFCETKKGCDAVTRQLRMDGWPALSIHGDKSQHERDWVRLRGPEKAVCVRCGEADGRLCGSLGCNEHCAAGQHGAAATCIFCKWACC